MTAAFITSLGFPNYYSHDARCSWDIIVPYGSYVALHFVDVDIAASSDECLEDYVRVLDVIDEASETVLSLGDFCNHNTPPAELLSSWNSLRIVFTTDSSLNGRGFVARYEARRVQLSDELSALLEENQTGSGK